ncbi:MAG: hypothetical protein DWQ44_10440 [Bacteroidetes bacterium]|nr:MAG: hypothetical protein DWQ33_06645 [Bacteroidota bacterium]REJ99732.1 MAG: hypothetical protein DWQ39_12445 [Bacteroidota bacterium]REK32926.1 MAG: hypothetical protein DWQ44_10440 [Bacteroidota bacterium]REK47731.1 MAG: hypothetical protein DWQ48_12180 [Bacteroidota bacterium]
MKSKFIISVLMFLSTACIFRTEGSSADFTYDKKSLAEFYSLKVDVPANIILSQSDAEEIRIEGERRELTKVSSNVDKGTLIISGKNSVPLTIYLSVKNLNRIEVNGSARVFVNGLLNSDVMLLKVNGSGSISADVRSLALGLIVKGDGKIYARGSTGRSFAKITGHGQISTTGLSSFNHTESVMRNESEIPGQTEKEKKNSKRPLLRIHE